MSDRKNTEARLNYIMSSHETLDPAEWSIMAASLVGVLVSLKNDDAQRHKVTDELIWTYLESLFGAMPTDLHVAGALMAVTGLQEIQQRQRNEDPFEAIVRDLLGDDQ